MGSACTGQARSAETAGCFIVDNDRRRTTTGSSTASGRWYVRVGVVSAMSSAGQKLTTVEARSPHAVLGKTTGGCSVHVDITLSTKQVLT
jgi:hypothetical protein